jgi:hypothetical protein
MSSGAANQIIHGELTLDGNARQSTTEDGDGGQTVGIT